MTMSFAYGLHRKKLILTGRWPYATQNEDYNIDNSDKINSRTVAGTPAIPRDEPMTMTDTSSWGGLARVSLGGDYTNQERSMTSLHHTISPLQDPAILAVVGPGKDGMHGCLGQSGALDRLVGVVGGDCMERLQPDSHGIYRPYYSRTQALPTTPSSHWWTSPWVTCSSAPTISHSTSSVTWPWHTVV